MNITAFFRTQWDRAGAWICIAAGAVVLFAGWWGISGTTEVGRQLPFIISGGLFGVFLLGLGGMLWVSADLRDEWRELWAIRSALAAIANNRESEHAPGPRLTQQERNEAAALLTDGTWTPSDRRPVGSEA